MTIPSIYFDTCCFIDLIKDHFKLAEPGRQQDIKYYKDLIAEAGDSKIRIITSAITIGECKYMRYHLGDQVVKDKGDEVKRIISGYLLTPSYGITLSVPDIKVTTIARDLCWDHDIWLKGTDAFHLATALKDKCEEFITTDGKDFIDEAAKIAKLGINVIPASKSRFLPASSGQTAIDLSATGT